MSTLSDKINSVMLQALSKYARNYRCDITEVRMRLSLNDMGELIVEIMHPGAKENIPVSLSQAIGLTYAMMAKGRLKVILRELQVEMKVKASNVCVLISTLDRKNIYMSAYKNGNAEKELAITDIIN